MLVKRACAGRAGSHAPAAFGNSRQVSLQCLEVEHHPVLRPAVQNAAVRSAVLLSSEGRLDRRTQVMQSMTGGPVLLYTPHLRGGVIREDGAVLHNDVEEVQPVHVGQALEVVVRRAAVVELGHQLGVPLLAACQELRAQLLQASADACEFTNIPGKAQYPRMCDSVACWDRDDRKAAAAGGPGMNARPA